MMIRLYRGDRVLLVVPDCMHASMAATARFGALRFLGEVDQACFGAAEWARISAGFDADSFAEVPGDMVRYPQPPIEA